MTDGSTSYAQRDAIFNSAFAIGADQGGDIASAAACTVNTVQQNTGVRIDHFAVNEASETVRSAGSQLPWKLGWA